MSNAEQAWKEFNTECNPIWDDVDGESDETQVMAGFLAGYTRGSADALVLPEVRAEELEEGKIYRGLRDRQWVLCRFELLDWGDDEGQIEEEDDPALFLFGQEIPLSPGDFTKFCGPLNYE